MTYWASELTFILTLDSQDSNEPHLMQRLFMGHLILNEKAFTRAKQVAYLRCVGPRIEQFTKMGRVRESFQVG